MGVQMAVKISAKTAAHRARTVLRNSNVDDIWPFDADRDYAILTESHFVAQRFFREINEGLDRGSVPKLQKKCVLSEVPARRGDADYITTSKRA
jgi:acid phosphatase class B